MSEELEEYMEDEYDLNLDEEHFDIYEQKHLEEEVTEDFLKKENADVTGLKSKFTPAEEEIKQIAELKGEIRKASVSIIAHLSDSEEVRKYYGLLKAFYISFKTLIDGYVIKKLDPKFETVNSQITTMKEEGVIPDILYDNLAKMTEYLYKAAQFKGLGMIVEKTGFSSNANKKIVGE